MKVQIRSGVFETNSSSMHSIVIKNEDEYYTKEEMLESIYTPEEGNMRFYAYMLDFDRSRFECLATFESKVRYAIVSLCGYRENAAEVFDGIKKTVIDLIPECKNIILPKDSCGYFYYGCVGKDILSPFLLKKGITLKEFLSNKKYVVMVDGDEYCIWENLKDSGLIDKSKISEEFPNYSIYD